MQDLHCSHTVMLQFMASVRFPMTPPSVWECWTWTKVSIRAYDAQQSFRVESLKRIDHYSRTARISWNLNRWIGFRIDVLGASFTAGLAAYLVYGKVISAANTGLSLNMAVSFCTYIFWLIRIFNQLEVQSNRRDSVIGTLSHLTYSVRIQLGTYSRISWYWSWTSTDQSWHTTGIMAYKWRFKSRESFCTIFSGIRISSDTGGYYSFIHFSIYLVRAHGFA